MHKPIYVSFCNQKGGVGKSSFTTIASCYMYHKGFNVAVVDCDYPQHTIFNFRKWEVEQIKTNDFYNSQAERLYKSLEKPVFPIFSSKAEDALSTVENVLLKSKADFDVVFFDLPGTINNIGVLNILKNLDYFFTPMEASLPVLESSLNFACGIKDILEKRGIYNDNIHLFWNKEDRRERNELYSVYEENVITPLALPLLKTRIPLSSRFRKLMNGENRQFLISTIFPPSPSSIRDTNIDMDSFMNEIIAILKLNYNDTRAIQKEVS